MEVDPAAIKRLTAHSSYKGTKYVGNGALRMDFKTEEGDTDYIVLDRSKTKAKAFTSMVTATPEAVTRRLNDSKTKRLS